MNETTVELAITIRGDESALEKVHKLLSSETQDCPPMLKILAEISKQTLIAAGVNEDIQVELHNCRLSTRYTRGGGLNADEWLDKEEETRVSTDEWLESH
jgi:hypothetical protein